VAERKWQYKLNTGTKTLPLKTFDDDNDDDDDTVASMGKI
jgi:hypothetical protein